VYVREAHAEDEWAMESNRRAGVALVQPRSQDERCAAARSCVADMGLSIPTVVDGLDDAVSRAYGAWPERLYVIDAAGVVLYRGGPGPFEFAPEEVAEVLARIRAAGPR
jgi:hypothetical protein